MPPRNMPLGSNPGRQAHDRSISLPPSFVWIACSGWRSACTHPRAWRSVRVADDLRLVCPVLRHEGGSTRAGRSQGRPLYGRAHSAVPERTGRGAGVVRQFAHCARLLWWSPAYRRRSTTDLPNSWPDRRGFGRFRRTPRGSPCPEPPLSPPGRSLDPRPGCPRRAPRATPLCRGRRPTMAPVGGGAPTAVRAFVQVKGGLVNGFRLAPQVM